ncbi:hypothetical protein T440DRAFT_471229 [Plenodomus tracheiphilus IPT5]|uniref:Zn(2)-C6 fungal-type domain-containing protein n=1 Tax=Plenodomus tracheiphilus IPT5 TaxID=1408161 RepID=A0A6A7AV13_9PLEO|nr:hypothetical protein T440DRAFT_471229 [Plenodomus tracheiphilus IPT5]
MSSAASTHDATGNVNVDAATARAAPEPTSSPPNGPPARSAGLKLRDCCQACARSKVRCTKEKPSCSRCETKGIPCRYLQSKRPGRIPGSGDRRGNPAARTRTSEGPTRRAGAAPDHDCAATATTTTPAAATATATATTSWSPAATAPDGLAPDDARFRADSLFEAYFGAADVPAADLSPGLACDGDPDSSNTKSSNTNNNSDDNAPCMWVDCLDVLATMNDSSSYASLMDWDSPGSALTAHLSLPMDMDMDVAACHGLSVGGSVVQSPTRRLLPMASQVPATSSVPTQTGSASSSASSASSSASSSSASSLMSSSSYPTSLSTRTTPPAAPLVGRPPLKSVVSAPVLDHNLQIGTPSSCSCLDKALDLLKEVNRDPCLTPSMAGCAATQVILAKNKEIIQATLAILACVACMEDRLLIMISLLITMKMLPRYASAAALTASANDLLDEASDMSRHNHGSLSANAVPITDPNLPRQAKQQVLRELHLVQRLITQLSARLKSLASPGRHPNSAHALLERRPVTMQTESTAFVQKTSLSNSSLQTACGETQLVPISTRTLDFVEDDVRNSLSSLSAVVRQALKES